MCRYRYKGYPRSLSGYLDPYPVLFHGVSVSQYLTHSRKIYSRLENNGQQNVSLSP